LTAEQSGNRLKTGIFNFQAQKIVGENHVYTRPVQVTALQSHYNIGQNICDQTTGSKYRLSVYSTLAILY
jgi:hypothetical protein